MRYFCEKCGYSWIYDADTCPLCGGLREKDKSDIETDSKTVK